jgi:hypothetical protein
MDAGEGRRAQGKQGIMDKKQGIAKQCISG